MESKIFSKQKVNYTCPVKQEGSFFELDFKRPKVRKEIIKFALGSAYSKLIAATSVRYFNDAFGGVTSVRFSPTGSSVAVGFTSGDLQVLNDLGEREELPTVILKGWEGNDSISCVHFHPKKPNLLYAATTAGTIELKDLEEVSEMSKTGLNIITEESNEINTFDFDTTGTTLVTGGKDAILRLYDTSTNKLKSKFGRPPDMVSETSVTSYEFNTTHEKRIYCVKHHPEQPNVLVSGGWDSVLKIWDKRTPTGCIRNIIGPYIFGEAIDINKGQILTASCIACNSLDLWDLGSGLLVKEIVPSNKKLYLSGEFPYAAQFFKGDPSGDLVLSGGLGLGGLQLISIKEMSILCTFEDEKAVVSVDSSDTNIAFGGKSNTVLHGNIVFPRDTVELSAVSPDLSSEVEVQSALYDTNSGNLKKQ